MNPENTTLDLHEQARAKLEEVLTMNKTEQCDLMIRILEEFIRRNLEEERQPTEEART